VGYVARMREISLHLILVENPESKRLNGRRRRRCEDSIKTNINETGCENVDLIQLAQDRDQWQALVNTVIHIRIA
jgi:hypothetical protein